MKARYFAAWLALLAACQAAPPPPPPVVAPAPAPAPRRFLPVLTVEGSPAKLTARDPEGKVAWSMEVQPLAAYAPAPDGGAYVRSQGKGAVLVRVDPTGAAAWAVPAEGAHLARIQANDALVVVESTYDRKETYALYAASDGASLTAPQGRLVPHPGGGVVVLDEVVSRRTVEGKTLWSVAAHGFPAADPARPAPGPSALAVAPSGVTLVGFPDGALLGLDAEGRALFQLGVRGAVRGIAVRPAGDFAVSCDGGTITVVAADGAVRWEASLGAASLGAPLALPGGEIAVLAGGEVVHLVGADGAHRWHAPLPWQQASVPGDDRLELDGDRLVARGFYKSASVSPREPHAPPLEVVSSAAYRVERLALPPKVSGAVFSLVALGPSEVWALAGRPKTFESMPGPILVRTDGARLKSEGPIKRRFAKEDFAVRDKERDYLGDKLFAGEFNVHALARSPRGTLLALGARDHGLSDGDGSPGDVAALRAACVLERRGASFEERRELYHLFRAVGTRWGLGYGPLRYAASAGGHEHLCVADACVHVPPGGPPVAAPAKDGAFTLAYAGESLWSAGQRDKLPVLLRGEEIALRGWPLAERIWAGGEGDVWALSGGLHEPSSLYRYDGRSVTVSQSPLAHLDAIWGSGPDDVWAVGPQGAVHFDGRRWERILGLPGDLRDVTGVGRGEVWIGGDGGLWHVTRAPSAEPAMVAVAPPAPSTTRPVIELAVAGVDASYRLERASWPVAGGAPLRAALGVARGPGGALFLADEQRAFEVVGEEARPTKDGARACPRCPGWAVTGLPEPSAVAVAPSSALWVVSAGADDGLPHVGVRTARGLRLFPGLPAAAYVDVAARADDDVWIAGGAHAASDGVRRWPSGEGVLLHFDGRTFTRHRGPGGALLAVAPAGASEAWAVGAAGSVVHASAAGTTAYRVAGAPVLRGVAVAAPDEVWIAGSGGTLLRFDGKALRRVDTAPAGRDAAFTAILPPGKEPGWVVGPAGIFRIVPAR